MNPDDLLAYVDGELDSAEVERFERELEKRPEWMSSLSDLYRQRLLLAEAAREAPARSPASERRLAAVAGSRRLMLGIALGFSAAAVMALAVGAILYLAGRGAPAGDASAVAVAPRPALVPREIVVGNRPATREAVGGAGFPEEPDEPWGEPPDAGIPPAVADAPGATPASPIPDASPAKATAVPSAAPRPPHFVKPFVPPPAQTEPLMARLESVAGRVVVHRGAAPRQSLPATKGAALWREDTLEVPAKGSVVIRYPDGSRVEAGPDTDIDLSTHTGDAKDLNQGAGAGKKIRVRTGLVSVDATRQPEGLPLLLVTPQAEVRVLGTRFALFVEETGTRVEVTDGRVRMTRREDGALVEVVKGHFAVAAKGFALESRPMRVASGLVALYRFNESHGAVVRDAAPAGPMLPLRVANDSAVSWVPGGLVVHEPVTVASVEAAAKVIQSCQATRELTVEAWVRPREPDQGGAILTLLSNPYNLNFMLEQQGGGGPSFVFHLRTSKTGEDGVSLAARGAAALGRLAHIVYTRAVSGAGALYVDGARRAEHVVPGDFSSWDNSYRLAIAGDAKGRKPWLGEYRLVAVYRRALPASEVQMNYRAGAD
jgi:ferric-dicitrate binding protein FerR (iron transport regulator)